MALYNNLATNLIGDEAEEMKDVWDDDAKFDKWLVELEKKRKTSTKTGGKKKHISQEEYLAKHARHYGGE